MTILRYLGERKFFPLLAKIHNSNVLEVGTAEISYENKCGKGNTFTKIDIKKGNCEYGDVTNLKYKNEEFDCVICLFVLEHLIDYQKALDEMKRVLKPKGKLVLGVPMTVFLHDRPTDYWRFTKYSLKHLLNDFNNLIIIEVGFKRMPFLYVLDCNKGEN